MSFRHTLKMALKRGALVAAANWPVALVQAAADALFKMLIVAPMIGGVVLASLVIGGDIDEQAPDWRVLLAGVVSSLLEHRIVLLAFALSLAVVVVGGSLFIFLVKGGTIGVLVRGDRQAGAIELEPLHFDSLGRASGFSIELFVESSRAFFQRFARLGFVLMAVYLASGISFVVVLLWAPFGDSWGYTSLVTLLFALWVTIVNLLYLLVQIVIVADDCGVAAAARRVIAFLRQQPRIVGSVFGVVLAMVALATGASVIAFGALSLILVIPFVWFAAIPLQLMAFLLRALVFQYIDLASIATYLKLYREHGQTPAPEMGGVAMEAWAPPTDLAKP